MMIKSHVSPIKFPKMPHPACMCGKPLMIVIPPGGHFHPCHIHPEFAVYSDIRYRC